MKFSFFKEEALKPVIVSLGGSIFSRSDGLATGYLREFAAIIRDEVSRGRRFVIVTGGGVICRTYQKAAQELATISDTDLDWIGIASTRMNAQLLRSILSDIAHPDIIENPSKPPKSKKPVVIGAGWMPGNSSDHDAVLLARHYRATQIVNLGSAEFVYAADPRTNPNAQRFTDLNWEHYAEIIPKEWTPGMSAPFDPIASKEAATANISVVIMNGLDLPSFKSYLATGKNKTGTLIHP